MKKWTEIKEQIDTLAVNGSNPANIAEALQDLTTWLDNYFYGEWRNKEKLLETWKLGLRISQMSEEARRVMEKSVGLLEDALHSSR